MRGAPHARPHCLQWLQAATQGTQDICCALCWRHEWGLTAILLQAPRFQKVAWHLCVYQYLDYCAEQALGMDFSMELQFGRSRGVLCSMDAMHHNGDGQKCQQNCNGEVHANVAEQPLNDVSCSEEVSAQALLAKCSVCDHPLNA